MMMKGDNDDGEDYDIYDANDGDEEYADDDGGKGELHLYLIKI